MNNTATVHTGVDLLQVFDTITVNNEEKISLQDREYCENEQTLLYQTLARQMEWYEFLKTRAEANKGPYETIYLPNGKVDAEKPYRKDESPYEAYEYKIWPQLNAIIDKRHSAVKEFINRIINYFNETYKLNLEKPVLNIEDLTLNLQPDYRTYVDYIMAELGGKSFRQCAEDIILNNFLEAVQPGGYQGLPTLKNTTITIPDFNVTNYDEYGKKYGLKYSGGTTKLSSLCAGIVLFSDKKLTGGLHTILAFNEKNIDVTDWYPLNTTQSIDLKFFKNGRVDIRFPSKIVAQNCFSELKIDQF